ncbi:MAG: UbiA prenyltransferase family protein [Chloroflexi bacterium]|nr:UbiA prenyltransferase family protein [Chloroflexota bacterium]
MHLRLHYQLTLAPIFFWGYLWAGGDVRVTLLGAFAAFHLFLYGGITAYNTAYDRDTGPVGGLYRPPEVSPALLPFSLAVQLLGLLLVLPIGWQLTLVYVVLMGLSVGYSHPRIRWKASPLASSLVVFGGQGVLGFLAGWLAAGGSIASALSPTGLAGAVSAAGVTLGLYPLGQLFQLNEDSARGDRTLALVIGPDRVFRLSQLVLALSGALAVVMVGGRFGLLDASLFSLGFLAAIALLDRLRRNFRRDAVRATYVHVMRLQALLAAGFTVYILARLLLPDLAGRLRW